jgi:transposase
VLEEDQRAEETVARVAACDIGKAELVCCVRVPHPQHPDRRLQEVVTYSTMTRSLLVMADRLAELGVSKVVMEATSDYWKPVYYLLEAYGHGLSPELVNARDVKHLPGRPKTDRLDAVWLCKVAERGMIRPSFVPPLEIRRLRDVTRYRADLVEARTAEKQRVEKLLEESRPGARCPDYSGSVSPGRSPNPPCASRRNGLSTGTAVMRGSAPRGSGCWVGSGTG